MTIHEWPTRLMLVNVPEKYQERADEILGEFEKAMPSTRRLIRWLRVPISVQTPGATERQMETIVNGIVLLMLLAVESFLLRMKMKMDSPEASEGLPVL